MTAARKLWTDEHQQLLQRARQAAGVSDVAFARDNAIALRHLQQLETGGASAFYSESIKYDTGVKLLRRLGVEPQPVAEPSEIASTEPAAADAVLTLASMPKPVTASTSPPRPQDATEVTPNPALPAQTSTTPGQAPAATRVSYVVLSLVGLGLIGAGISLIPSIHQPGATQGVLQSSSSALGAASSATSPPALIDAGSDKSLQAQPVSMQQAPPAVISQQAAGAVPEPTCEEGGAAQTIAPTQPSKSADYVYLTAVNDVTLCVRDAAGQVTRKSLQAGQSYNIPGRQPFEVTADKLPQLRVFFQGQRIWFDASATRLRLTAATPSD